MLGREVSGQEAITTDVNNRFNLFLPSIDSLSQTSINQEIQEIKKENETLKQHVAKLENKLNHVEKQFKTCLEQGFKLIQELNELKAFKKSLAQYVT